MSDTIEYRSLMHEAMRGLIRKVLEQVSEHGLPGAHHFYITFLTRFPGAEIDDGLKKKYPEEITIVLEHQFWDLTANEEDFEVTLKFGGVPKYLRVPYMAITRFHDPSVGFALQFEPPREMEGTPQPPTLTKLEPKKDAAPAAPATKAKAEKKPAKKKKAAKKAPEPEAEKTDEDNVVSLDSFRKK